MRPPEATIQNDSGTIQITLAQLNAAIAAAFKPEPAYPQPPTVSASGPELLVRISLAGDKTGLLTLAVTTVQTTRGGVLELRAVGLDGVLPSDTLVVKQAQTLVQSALEGLIQQAVTRKASAIEYLDASLAQGVITVSVRFP
jgi:hypothetical protein